MGKALVVEITFEDGHIETHHDVPYQRVNNHHLPGVVDPRPETDYLTMTIPAIVIGPPGTPEYGEGRWTQTITQPTAARVAPVGIRPDGNEGGPF